MKTITSFITILLFLLSTPDSKEGKGDKVYNYISNPGFESKRKKDRDLWFNPDAAEIRTPNFIVKNKDSDLHEYIFGAAENDSYGSIGILGFKHNFDKTKFYNEFVTNTLVQELEVDSLYKFSLKYTLGTESGSLGFSQYALQGMGIHLSEEIPTMKELHSLKGGFAQFKGLWDASGHWEESEIYFRPNKPYKYITIGFFVPLKQMNESCFSSFKVHDAYEPNDQKIYRSGWAYYFMDDFLLTKDFDEEMPEVEITTFPNSLITHPKSKKNSNENLVPVLQDDDNNFTIELNEQLPPKTVGAAPTEELKSVSNFVPRANLQQFNMKFLYEKQITVPSIKADKLKKQLSAVAAIYNSASDKITGITIWGFAENVESCKGRKSEDFGKIEKLSYDRAKHLAEILHSDFGIPNEVIMLKVGIPDREEKLKFHRRTEISFTLSEKSRKSEIELKKGDWISFEKQTKFKSGPEGRELAKGEIVKVCEIREKDNSSKEIIIFKKGVREQWSLILSENNPPTITFRRILPMQKFNIREGVPIYSNRECINLIRETQSWEEITIISAKASKARPSVAPIDSTSIQYNIINVFYEGRCPNTKGYIKNLKPEDMIPIE